MYTFNNDGSKLLSIDPVTQLISDGEAAYSFTKEFKNDEVGVFRFLFVANDEVAGATLGMSQADFEKLPMTQVLAADGTSKDLLTKQDGTDVIPMTGMAHQGSSTDIAVTATTAPIQVTLTRVWWLVLMFQIICLILRLRSSISAIRTIVPQLSQRRTQMALLPIWRRQMRKR